MIKRRADAGFYIMFDSWQRGGRSEYQSLSGKLAIYFYNEI